MRASNAPSAEPRGVQRGDTHVQPQSVVEGDGNVADDAYHYPSAVRLKPERRRRLPPEASREDFDSVKLIEIVCDS